MIISKTPLRMSFVGGGSDLPAFYREHGGAVISSSINKYVYIILKKKFESGYRLSYSITENISTREEIKHELIRNALKMQNLDESLEIVSIADVPSGTGLGSSSSFSVGLLNALNFYKKQKVNQYKRFLAEEACKLEIDICKSPIGKQDQYAAAFGDLRLYEFKTDDSVEEKIINCLPETKQLLSRNMLTFYIGGMRSANKILQSQNVQLQESSKQRNMKKMVNLVWDLKSELESNNLDSFGDILHENWLLKRGLTASITNPEIDDIYDQAMSLGAKGGKLLGAGGGGFMIFFIPDERKKKKIQQKFNKLRQVNLEFEDQGSCIIGI